MKGQAVRRGRRLLKLKIYKHARASEKRASVNIADMNCERELSFFSMIRTAWLYAPAERH